MLFWEEAGKGPVLTATSFLFPIRSICLRFPPLLLCLPSATPLGLQLSPEILALLIAFTWSPVCLALDKLHLCTKLFFRILLHLVLLQITRAQHLPCILNSVSLQETGKRLRKSRQRIILPSLLQKRISQWLFSNVAHPSNEITASAGSLRCCLTARLRMLFVIIGQNLKLCV